MWWRIETCSRWIGEQEYRSVRFDLETLSSGTLNRPEFLSTLTILPLEVEDEKRFRATPPPAPGLNLCLLAIKSTNQLTLKNSSEVCKSDGNFSGCCAMQALLLFRLHIVYMGGLVFAVIREIVMIMVMLGKKIVVEL